jgi:deazaflavin-dependent oxidoreductase (nitroreductase family)
MSDESSAAISAARKDWVMEHRELYLGSGGVAGHIMDITAVGGYFYAPHLLLKYRGRNSGKIFITPLCYVTIGGEVVVCGSKGGADQHPNWYLNLIEAGDVEFQVATQAFRGSWREPQGKEREKVWACLLASFPFYANYQTSTSRVLPLVMIQPREVIPVFRPEDATGIRQV